MKIGLMCVGLLGLAGLSSVALADISGGPVYVGGGRQALVRCMVYNAGPGIATITNHVITTGGTPVPLFYDVCGATLNPGRLCVIAATEVAQVAHSCRFRTSGGNLRGTIAVYGETDNMLHSSDMR
jgi:hypothetical protein